MRPKKITSAVIEQIPKLLRSGKTASEIAEAFGCKLSTLRVRCSQFGISLRSAPKRKQEKLPPPSSQLNVWLSPDAMENLRQQARAEKIPESKLAAALLEAAAEHDLYKAILVRDEQ